MDIEASIFHIQIKEWTQWEFKPKRLFIHLFHFKSPFLPMNISVDLFILAVISDIKFSELGS